MVYAGSVGRGSRNASYSRCRACAHLLLQRRWAFSRHRGAEGRRAPPTPSTCLTSAQGPLAVCIDALASRPWAVSSAVSHCGSSPRARGRFTARTMDRQQRAAARADAVMMQMTASHHAAPPNPAYVEALKGCREALHEFIDDANCAPILLRTAWHDAGTYDPRRAPADAWPAHGGANGSIRFDNELAHGANAGLPKGIKFLQPFKTVRSLTGRAEVKAAEGERTGSPFSGFLSPLTPVLLLLTVRSSPTQMGRAGPRAAPGVASAAVDVRYPARGVDADSA